MPLTWGLFPTLVTSLGPGAAARDRRAPSAFAPGSQRPGLVRHGQKGRFPQGTGQELPCPAHCYMSPPAKHPLPLNKNPLGAP